jgi:hypothetical protein
LDGFILSKEQWHRTRQEEDEEKDAFDGDGVF